MEKANNSKWNEFKYYKVFMWIGSALLIITGYFLMMGKPIDSILSTSALMGMMLMAVSFFQSIGMGELKEERLRKIGTTATTYSWWAALGFISALVAFGSNPYRVFTWSEMLGLAILVMVSTMLIANTILTRRGDIE